MSEEQTVVDDPGVVYLLHFHDPIAPGRHTTQHYIGWAADLGPRINAHRHGTGARLTQVAGAVAVGSPWPERGRATATSNAS